MTGSLRYRLTEAEKDALMEREALLIDAQAAQIAALLARIEALEAAQAENPSRAGARGFFKLSAPEGLKRKRGD